MPYLPHSRRKPLSVIVCCELFALAGGLLPSAHAQQLQPLKIDPALLGASPVPPAKAPAAVPAGVVPAPSVQLRSEPAEKSGAEVRPVTASSPVPDAPRHAPAEETAKPEKTTEAREANKMLPLAPQGVEAPLQDSPGALSPAPLSSVPDPALRLAPKLLDLSGKTDDARPVFISAERMSGQAEREALADGDVELRKIGTVVNSDHLIYWPIDDEFEATGSVRLQQGDDVVTGPKMRMKIADQVGFFETPEYFLKRESTVGRKLSDADRMLGRKPVRTLTEIRGQGERIDFEGVNQVRVDNGTFTTCKPGNDDWYAQVSDLKLDFDREVGEGNNTTVRFLGVPILYAPWLSFSLNNQRKSGLLTPTFGTTSKSGFELTVPYYLNIAPNMDATIASRLFSKRGLQVNTEFRYLDPNYNGQARVELLPDDQVRHEKRFGVSLLHNQSFGYGLYGALNFNRVSDDYYYTDLSSRIANTSQTQLLQQGVLTWAPGSWWTATANLQSYQTLQPDPANPVLEPYRLLPQITFNGVKPDWYMTDTSLLGQFSVFSHRTKVEGQRMVLYPQVALPYIQPGWYVTPKIGVHATHWSLTHQDVGTPNSFNRTLPVFSIDSGMTFERSSQWFGREYTQTLEPRLFYLKVPYRDQSSIPIFDTGLADFNFAQIFAENQFVGQDRFNDANQLTAAVSSRLIEPGTGREMMRAMIGQRFYFSDQQVVLPNQAKRVWAKSDLLASLSGQLLPKLYGEAALQYNTGAARSERFSVGARYMPEFGKVLNAAYRFNRDSIDQVDVAGQWPIGGGWHAVGRYNYSLRERQPIETIGGLEYNGGCWVIRTVGQRLATTSGTSSTALFVQLELSDFSHIGSNPLELLRRNIQGYGRINQPTDDPVFGQ